MKRAIEIAIALTALSSVFMPVAALAQFVETTAADLTEARAFKISPSKSGAKLGLALGGGGTRGAAHLGVLEIFEKEGIKFDVIVGTSVGAIVGGLSCLGMSSRSMQEEFRTGRIFKSFMTVPIEVRLAVAPLMLVPRVFGHRAYDGLYKGNKFRKYLTGGEKQSIKIEDLKPRFAATAFNVLDGKPYLITGGDLGYALQATSAIPALRKPVEIGDKLFVDGGIGANLPVKQCREMGADIVIAVNVDKPFEVKRPEDFCRAGSITKRLIDFTLYDIDRPQELMADVVLHPDTSDISPISTDRRDILKGVAAGVKEAIEKMPEIRKKLEENGIAHGKCEECESVTLKEAASRAAEIMNTNLSKDEKGESEKSDPPLRQPEVLNPKGEEPAPELP